MASEKSVKIRDRLNQIVDELIEDVTDQEANILACCVSVAVEEVEKYMYKGEFTPSVQPFRTNKKWEMPFKPGEEDDEKFSGPPWVRVKKNIFSEMPTLKKLREQAEKIPVQVRKNSVLDKLEPGEWNKDLMDAFKQGNSMVFMGGIRELYPQRIPVNELTDYLTRMKRQYSHLWNNGMMANTKGTKV